MRVLITGGAGFIGSHLADELLAHGYSVRVLDCLESQVHGNNADRPEHLADGVELLRGDVRDPAAVRHALQNIDAVFHFAAMVGVGQSMYQISRYTEVNNLGTSVLLETLQEKPIQRLVVASSMSIYGEGLYQDADGHLVAPPQRQLPQLCSGQWELVDESGRALQPVPTPETKPPDIASIYALSKFDQERMCLIFGRAYGIDTVALRFFNCYGPRQALSNPYTGVLAIFASRCLNGHRPLVFEDGKQRRDFVNVHDVARACRLALETPEAAGRVFNIGSGEAITVCEVAERTAEVLHRSDLKPQVVGRYRTGDIRHCFADITQAREVLGYQPQVTFQNGLIELAEWIAHQEQIEIDQVERAQEELTTRGLVV